MFELTCSSPARSRARRDTPARHPECPRCTEIRHGTVLPVPRMLHHPDSTVSETVGCSSSKELVPRLSTSEEWTYRVVVHPQIRAFVRSDSPITQHTGTEPGV